MAVGREAPSERKDLVVSREPVGPNSVEKGGRGSNGDQAFKDAVMIVAVAWLVLVFLVLSLRTHNI